MVNRATLAAGLAIDATRLGCIGPIDIVSTLSVGDIHLATNVFTNASIAQLVLSPRDIMNAIVRQSCGGLARGTLAGILLFCNDIGEALQPMAVSFAHRNFRFA